MDTITDVSLVDEMKQAYGDYSMAVLLGRAIPDLYDGLKPATRRVLTAMKWLGLSPSGRYMKSARVEGETMGKLHPHSGCYGTMVTAAQLWTNNHPLVDGWGNWGSPTDNPAASRYTEAKLTEYAWSVLLDDSDTWETRPNYDGSLKEPIQLNSKIPNILMNGAEGIGVGFATRIPTHNLRGIAKALPFVVAGDVAKATKELIPDIPTGSDIIKDEGLLEYLNTGRGAIRQRAKVEHSEVEHGKRAKRSALTFTCLPFHVSTEQVGKQIKDGVESGKITTVADVRDESDRTGIRLVVICKAKVSTSQAEAEIYRYTSLDNKFAASNLVIDGTKPVQLNPYDICKRWLTWRDGRLVVKFTAELATNRKRLEVVQGLLLALDTIDDVIDTIRRSKDKADARARLMKRSFTEIQANAILDMRLSQLTKLDSTTLKSEAKAIAARVKELIKLNSSNKLRSQFILDEVNEVALRHGNARRSKVVAEPKKSATITIKQGKKEVQVKASGPKPRFIQVDEKQGVVTQLKRLERNSWVVPADQKMIFICDNGKFYKVGARHKGPVADTPTKVLARRHTGDSLEIPVLVVFELEGNIHANAIPWTTFEKCTSRGKSFLPEGAELIYLGTTYTVERKGRRKDVILTPQTVKPRPVGGKANKIAKADELP